MINLWLNDRMFIEPKRSMPSAWTGHIPFAAWLVEVLRPTLFVELGTYNGVSYMAICQAVCESKLNTKCYAVDTWEGDVHAGRYEESVYIELKQYNEANYQDFSILMKSTFDEACSYFEGNSIDLLHIDGLHTYEAVKHDFETWRPKLSKKAVVLFHDTNVHERNFGVWRYWGEISKTYPCLEFKHNYGLGVLLVGEDVPKPLLELANVSASKYWEPVERVFSTLAKLIDQRQKDEQLGVAVDLLRQKDEHLAVAGDLLRQKDEHLRTAAELIHERDELLAQMNARRTRFNWLPWKKK